MPLVYLNSGKSRNIVIIVRCRQPPTEVMHEHVLLSLFRSLETNLTPLGVQHHIELVCSNVNMTPDLVSPDDEDGTENDLTIALRLDDAWASERSAGGLLLPAPPEQAGLQPREVAGHSFLADLDNDVEAVGVSAVSDDQLCKTWKSIILTFNGGGGYMRHPMWRLWKPEEMGRRHDKWGNWSSVREWSYRFGWPGYAEEIRAAGEE